MLSFFKCKAHYNQWMNQTLYNACNDIPDELRRKNLGAFFGSVHHTLNHLLLVDLLWLSRINPQIECPATHLAQQLYTDYAELREARFTLDHQLIKLSNELTTAQLKKPVQYTSLQSAQPKLYPLDLILLHLFNHQTHHRGQITTLLSQLGVNSGCTDLIFMPDAEKLLSAEEFA
ncbi:DinB family protein [Rheinheimera faecalis]|uniref:DinB family protein n=1 Tax=Rheinheimera faecalis TaxID=2901141 RepID=UPI0022B84369|nr:DinB family protein [Rheinheimera faecalis]